MNIEAKLIFDQLKNATVLNDLRTIAEQSELRDAIKKKSKRYPKLELNFSVDDINQIAIQFDASSLPNPYTPLEKILYAVVWKRGDLLKVKHVVKGLQCTGDNELKRGITFFHFGKHLASPLMEPIIDRNVILAFAGFKYDQNPEEAKRYKRLSALGEKEIEIIKEYKEWIATNINENLRTSRESMSLIDDIIFVVGQLLRKTG